MRRPFDELMRQLRDDCGPALRAIARRVLNADDGFVEPRWQELKEQIIALGADALEVEQEEMRRDAEERREMRRRGI